MTEPPRPTLTRAIVITPNHPVEVQDLDVVRPTGSHIKGRLLYVRLPVHYDIGGLDYQLDSLLAERTDEADLVVIRCHGAVYQALTRSSVVRERLRVRFPWAQLVLLRWSSTSYTHEVLNAESLEPYGAGAQGLLELLRDVDYQASLEEPGATLPENPEFHYEGPNGLHYEQFIRAGYAFQSTDTIEGAAFWLLPYFNKVSFVVFDSWTMLGFGHTLAAYMTRESTKGRVPFAPVIECAEEYAEGVHLSERLASAIGDHKRPRAMVVTSVHSTGKTEAFLLEACTRAGLKVDRIVRLYGNELAPTRAEPTTTMHRLVGPIASSPAMLCDSCLTKRKSLVPIDKRSLLLALTAAVEETRITRTTARSARVVLERYASVGAFSIHRTEPGTGRHHMIYVDVERLLTNATFKRRVAEAAKKFTGRADVVLSPAHPAASALGAIVASTLGVRHIPCEQKAYENLEGKDAHALRAAEAILFVDDVAITGGRIRRVKAALGQARIITDKRDVELNMLVGVARPVGAAEWAGVQDMVGPENLRAVEFIELPNWGQEDCPWCSELARLLAFEKTHRIGGALASRLARLKQVEKGLDAELFLPSSPSAGGVQRAFVTEPIGEQAFQEAGAALPRQVVRTYPFSELGQGSIFGQLKEVELFVAVAASLQRLRNDRELSERSQYPLSRVLDPYLYFLGRFYANIIVACVLRGAKRRDLRTVDLEPVLRKAVGERLLEVESLELRAELLLAIYRTQLPLPQEASQTDVFARLDPSIAEFAHWLLNPGP